MSAYAVPGLLRINRTELGSSVVIQHVSQYYGVSIEKMKGKSRKRETVLARQMAMTLIRELKPEMTFEGIGMLFGDRDHTTVIHAKQTISDLCDTDVSIRTDKACIKRQLAELVNPTILYYS